MRAAHFVILPPANTALSYSKDEQAGLIPAAARHPRNVKLDRRTFRSIVWKFPSGQIPRTVRCRNLDG
jgi:hypothetical protein